MLQTIAREILGGQLGLTVVLHTWARDLLLRRRVHCVVTSGVLRFSGSGIDARVESSADR